MRGIIIITGMVALASCNNTKPKEAATVTTAPVSALVKPHEITDPVCGMVKDSTWKDYTVYKGDTVWFCSPTERDAFVGNPKRYEKKLVK